MLKEDFWSIYTLHHLCIFGGDKFVFFFFNEVLFFILGFPDKSIGKVSTCNAGDHSLIPGQEDPLEKG